LKCVIQLQNDFLDMKRSTLLGIMSLLYPHIYTSFLISPFYLRQYLQIFTEKSTDQLSTLIMQHRPRIIPTSSSASVPSLDPSSAKSLEAATAASTVREQLELVGRRSDGGVFPVSITLAQFKVNSKVYFGTYIRDITYTKNMEQQVNIPSFPSSPSPSPH
jgi:hypothetical protein